MVPLYVTVAVNRYDAISEILGDLEMINKTYKVLQMSASKELEMPNVS